MNKHVRERERQRERERERERGERGGLHWTYNFKWQVRANTYTSVYLLTLCMTYNFYIVSFQADKSVIGYLHTEMTKLLLLFLAKFVSTMVIRATTDVTNLDFRATSWFRRWGWLTTRTSRRRRSTLSSSEYRKDATTYFSNQTIYTQHKMCSVLWFSKTIVSMHTTISLWNQLSNVYVYKTCKNYLCLKYITGNTPIIYQYL